MPDTEVVYLKFNQPIADADHGKIRKGAVLAMPADRATRMKTIGVAEDASESEYKSYRDERSQNVAGRNDKQAEFDALNAQKAADWDTSTARDVTMAPESGLRRAHEQGRLVNTNLLKDEDGNVLPQDASLEQILDARNRLAFQESPLTAHERSSVQGGGPHLRPAFGGDVIPANVGDTLGGVQPLNQPSSRLSNEQLGNGPDTGDKPSRRSPGKAPAKPAPEGGAKGNEAR